ncbi:MAG: hypothetical protein E7617_04465 [Ruminococcaceae bacterium]|nr:hypothetical protein [Oscillospiraceae bacterium]
MKLWIKATAFAVFVLMFSFMCIGYAALTDTLSIRGSAKIEIPSGLFITNIEVDGTSNVDKNEYEFLDYTTTVKSKISRSGSNAGSVTYRITVLNNTDLVYSYRKIYFQANLSEYNGNAQVQTTNNSRKIGVVCGLANLSDANKKVAPGETLEFVVTYTVGRNLSAQTDWSTLINFQFGINVDGEKEALEVIEEKFINILNTPSTYLQLIDGLDNKYDGRQEWTSNYIGNVTGSTSADSMIVNTLFAGQLQITVGTDKKDATVLIKHENLDGNTKTGDDYVARNENNVGSPFYGYGCEMTFYMTIDPLTAAGQYVPVYAVVFTCDRDENGNIVSDWYRVGDTYSGEANVVTYDGGNGTGSFVTDNWRSYNETYTVVEGYSYNIDGEEFSLEGYSYSVSAGGNIESIVMAKDQNATNAFKTLITDAKRIIDNQKYAGIGIDLVEEAYIKYAHYYTVDANGNHIVDPDLTRAQLSSAIADVDYAVIEALKRIDAMSSQQV